MLVVQGRAAKFTDSAGKMGIVVVISEAPFSRSNEENSWKVEVTGSVGPDCVSYRGETILSSTPRALTPCTVARFKGTLR